MNSKISSDEEGEETKMFYRGIQIIGKSDNRKIGLSDKQIIKKSDYQKIR